MSCFLEKWLIPGLGWRNDQEKLGHPALATGLTDVDGACQVSPLPFPDCSL